MLDDKGLHGVYEHPKVEIPSAATRRKKDIETGIAKRGGKDEKAETQRAHAKKVRSIARSLVTDPKYVKELKKRLQAGVAGNIEIWLWRYAFGDPAKNDEQAKEEQERFNRLREQLLVFLEHAPERARVLDAAVTRSPRVLTLPPRQFPPEERDGST